jgi:hypothetical protein
MSDEQIRRLIVYEVVDALRMLQHEADKAKRLVVLAEDIDAVVAELVRRAW